MRSICCAFLLAILGSPIAYGDAEMPYQAYIMPEQAEVYSGRDESRYVTEHLERGEQVEVYEQHGEWLGIRPPSGSFSWVPAAGMTMSAEPGVASVKVEGIASWIGSAAGQVAKHQSAVVLKQGEPVEVLGQKEVETASGQREVWLKIAPPAGEFRWIHASQVSRDKPQRGSSTERANAGEGRWTTARAGTLAAMDTAAIPRSSDEESAETASYERPFRRSSMELRDLKPAPAPMASFTRSVSDVQLVGHEEPLQTEELPRRSLSSDGFVQRRPRTGRQRAAIQPSFPRVADLPRQKPAGVARPPEPIATAASPAEPAASSATGLSGAAVQRRLEEIDVALSLMIAQDRTQWNLGLLAREAQQLVEQGATPVDRGEARFMLEKIERFAQAFGVEEDLAAGDLPVGSVAARKAALEAATAPQYDGTGYLAPVRARSPVAPYALLDDNGNRLCYVSPVPGFNLREYENRKVGLFGKRGYVPDINAAHLLAERVVNLDKQVR